MTLATSDHIRQETRMKIIALAAAAASTVLASLPAAAKLNLSLIHISEPTRPY